MILYLNFKIKNNMHNSRAKYREIKNFSRKITNMIKYKIEAFSFAKIVILVWVIIWFISLFLTWIKSNDTNISWNVFNKITLNSWIIISILLFIILFLLFSYNKKEKIKKSANIIFRDYIIIIFISIILLVSEINNIWVILWLEIFNSGITYWNWIIIEIISTIFLFIWWFLLKNEYYWANNIYINDSREIKKDFEEKNNTKLPF